MNLLFLSIGRLEDFSQGGIYIDLLKKFHEKGHNVYIASSRERRSKLPTVREEINVINFFFVLAQLNSKNYNIYHILLEKIKREKGDFYYGNSYNI